MTAVQLTDATNAKTEAAINTTIKHTKRTARGYRNAGCRARILLTSAARTAA